MKVRVEEKIGEKRNWNEIETRFGGSGNDKRKGREERQCA